MLTLERVAGASDSSGGATTRPVVCMAVIFFESPLLDDLDAPASCEDPESCSVACLDAVDEGWFPMLGGRCAGWMIGRENVGEYG